MDANDSLRYLCAEIDCELYVTYEPLRVFYVAGRQKRKGNVRDGARVYLECSAGHLHAYVLRAGS